MWSTDQGGGDDPLTIKRRKRGLLPLPSSMLFHSHSHLSALLFSEWTEIEEKEKKSFT